MQNYVVHLQSAVSTGFRCQKAADSLDIDAEKKSVHHFEVRADVATPFNVGLIVGASGSGKTTLARNMFGDTCFAQLYDVSKPVIEQFPQSMSYDDCAAALSGIGLTSVPCWIRPMHTLSNGQLARAEAALRMSQGALEGVIAIDEWTSVVDRTVAKVMSHCVQKYARRSNRAVVLNSCHYDVIDWLNPDWIIDCNSQTYTDRRALCQSFKRSERLSFEVAEVGRETWPYFSRYHYLSEKLPGGKIFTFGLFEGATQIGFVCYAAYIIGDHKTFFMNRLVVHPDYAGMGIGIHLVNATAQYLVDRGYRVKSKFSSAPVFKAMSKDKRWRCTAIKKPIRKISAGKAGAHRQKTTMRHKTTTYHFDYVAQKKEGES